MAITKPPVLTAWADAGDKVQPSNAELSVGWPVSSTPPSRQRFNWVLNYVANAVRYFSRRGMPDYDAAETYMIGDRVIGDDGKTYKCLVDNTTAFAPSTNPAKWARWGFTLAELDAEGTTPAQFDNSLKRASTAFVKSSGLQINNIRTVSGAVTLAATDLGGEIVCNGSAYTVTLPVTTGLGVGAYGQMLIFANVATGNTTIAGNGTDKITAGINSVSSIVLQPGERAILILSSPGFWILVAGEANLKYAGSFGSSIAANGYQKLPSGLIVQWGTISSSTAAVAVTYPIAFPTAVRSVQAMSQFNGTAITTITTAPSTSGFSLAMFNTAGAFLSGSVMNWLAIGN